MNNRRTSLALLIALGMSSAFASGSLNWTEEGTAASYLLVLGRAATGDEIGRWSGRENVSIREQMAHLWARIERDEVAQEVVARKAFSDVFGRSAGDGELFAGDASGKYCDLLRSYLQRMASHPDEYTHVIDRAYRRVVRRGVYEEEVAYWRSHGVLPYVLLVGCIDDWARRNQPGLMVTTGTPTISINSVYLATARLSPQIAEEVRAVLGLPAAPATDFSYASGRTVIAPGAEKLVAGGRIHFVVAGASDLTE